MFTLSHLRAAAIFTAPVVLGIAVEASVDGESHRLVTYFGWYGLSAILIFLIVGLTIGIERRKAEVSGPVHHPRIVAGEVNSKYSTVGGPKIVDGEERQWPTIRLYAIPFRNVAETGDSASTASDVVATVETFAEDGAFLDRPRTLA